MERSAEYLASHDLPESCIAGAINFSHPTCSKRREDFVGTKPGARCQSHASAITI